MGGLQLGGKSRKGEQNLRLRCEKRGANAHKLFLKLVGLAPRVRLVPPTRLSWEGISRLQLSLEQRAGEEQTQQERAQTRHVTSAGRGWNENRVLFIWVCWGRKWQCVCVCVCVCVICLCIDDLHRHIDGF